MDCLACDIATGRIVPSGGFITETDNWTVNHIVGENVWPGWLVLQPRRHVEALYLLSLAESRELPVLLRRLDSAVRTALKAQKMYVCLFAESADCQHIHFHLIAQYPTAPARGPGIFAVNPDEYPDFFVSSDVARHITLGLREIIHKQTHSNR